MDTPKYRKNPNKLEPHNTWCDIIKGGLKMPKTMALNNYRSILILFTK